jgi:hypothetical protein
MTDKIVDILRKKNEVRQQAGMTTMEVPAQLELVEVLPKRGSMVIMTYGDPNIIGGNTVEMVTLVVDCSEEGLVTGWAFTQMGMTAAGPRGQPVALPPLIPVGNLPYNSKGAKLSWRYDTPEEDSND